MPCAGLCFGGPRVWGRVRRTTAAVNFFRMKALKPDTLTRLLPAMNYRSGDRRGADPGAPSNFFMVQASEVTDPEIEQAAAHFSKLPVKSFVKVVETAVPIVRALHARSFAELARDDAAPEQIAAHVALILDTLTGMNCSQTTCWQPRAGMAAFSEQWARGVSYTMVAKPDFALTKQ